MAGNISKLDQALIDLIEAFSEVEEKIDAKFRDDEDAFQTAIVEAIETSVEAAIEETEFSTSSFATLLSSISEALESLDPSAFDEEEEEESEGEATYDIDDDDIDIDDDDDEDADDDDSDDE